MSLHEKSGFLSLRIDAVRLERRSALDQGIDRVGNLKVEVVGILHVFGILEPLNVPEELGLLSVFVFKLPLLVSQQNFQVLEINIQVVLFVQHTSWHQVLFSVLS